MLNSNQTNTLQRKQKRKEIVR